MTSGKVFTFVSFKGGTGRTTTAGNIAYQLASTGKKVLVVDLDVDGPGMGSLIGMSDRDIGRDNLLAYFAAEASASPLDFVIQKEFSESQHEVIIDFMLSPMHVSPDVTPDTSGDWLFDKMDRLKKEVVVKYDAIIIDSASGVSDYSSLALAIANYAVVCLRWSQQHFMGTLHLFTLIANLLQSNRFDLEKLFALANAVPLPSKRVEYERHNFVIDTIQETMSDILGKDYKQDISIITESNSLKWKESIVTTSSLPVFAEYEKFASHILSECY